MYFICCFGSASILWDILPAGLFFQQYLVWVDESENYNLYFYYELLGMMCNKFTSLSHPREILLSWGSWMFHINILSLINPSNFCKKICLLSDLGYWGRKIWKNEIYEVWDFLAFQYLCLLCLPGGYLQDVLTHPGCSWAQRQNGVGPSILTVTHFPKCFHF